MKASDFTSEMDQRYLAVETALSWERTPFHDKANLKGVGVDCANYLYEVFRGAGLVPDYKIPPYTPQFLLHSSKEIFLSIVELFGRDITGQRDPLPADIIMFKYGRCFSHGAIVIEWPQIIHATVAARRVTRANVHQDNDLIFDHRGAKRKQRLYTLKQWG